ncbi:hypothetical protein AAKU55_004890 [Oxalobacteraceae bacterium GrIS 1.11]
MSELQQLNDTNPRAMRADSMADAAITLMEAIK